MRLVYVIIPDKDFAESDPYLHLPNAPDLSGGPPHTLCGWTDVAHEALYGTVNCPECLKIVRYCRTLKLKTDTDPRSEFCE